MGRFGWREDEHAKRRGNGGGHGDGGLMKKCTFGFM